MSLKSREIVFKSPIILSKILRIKMKLSSENNRWKILPDGVAVAVGVGGCVAENDNVHTSTNCMKII